jgi:hypothetical protein
MKCFQKINLNALLQTVDFRVAEHLGVILKFYMFEIIQILANLFIKQSKKPKQKIEKEKNKKRKVAAQLGQAQWPSKATARSTPPFPLFLFFFFLSSTGGPHLSSSSLTSPYFSRTSAPRTLLPPARPEPQRPP